MLIRFFTTTLRIDTLTKVRQARNREEENKKESDGTEG
jgi:hypothetical protein